MASDPTYPLYPILAFLGFTLVLIPLPWHLQAWNSGTCYYMLWTALACINQFVNSIVWADNAINVAPVWCDISTRIILGASVGIPAASLCINRRLYKIARMHAITITSADKRRAFIIDTLICVLFPLVYIAVSYVVQGHRFDIYEEIGCYPAIYNTLPAYFLVYMWPVVIGLISAVFCVMSLHALLVRRAQFKQFISSSTSLTSSRYFRLMALATTEMIFTLPLGTYELFSDSGSALNPWISWSDTHYDFSRVDQFPSFEWKVSASVVVPLELTRWIIPACAFVFFSFFGFAEEARKNYRMYYAFIKRHLPLSRSRAGSSLASQPLSSPIPSTAAFAHKSSSFISSDYIIDGEECKTPSSGSTEKTYCPDDADDDVKASP